MTFKTLLLGAAFAVLPAIASAHMVIETAISRASAPLAQTGAVYLTLYNHSDVPDRLVRIEGDVADRIEIHTHIQDAAGVMRMVELEDGITMESDETRILQPGADHIMLLGLTRPLVEGETFDLLLYFDVAVPTTVTVTVDSAAVAALAAGQQGSGDAMGHGAGHGTDG